MVRDLGIDRRGAEGAGRLRVLLDELIIGWMIVIIPAQGILWPIVVILWPVLVLILRDIITNRWTEVVVVLGKPSILGSAVPASASLRGGSTSGLPPVCPLWSRRRGADTAVAAAAAEERAVDGAPAAAAAGPAATAGTAVAAGKAAAAGYHGCCCGYAGCCWYHGGGCG